MHSETELIIPLGYHSEDYSYIFDCEIKELWLAKWQEITKDKRVKINQNTAFLLVGWLEILANFEALKLWEKETFRLGSSLMLTYVDKKCSKIQ